MNIHEYSGVLNRINTYMYQLASSHADKSNLYKQVSILQEAIDKRDDAVVDSQMTFRDAEFEKIALATNPSIAADRAKYAQEIAAKAAADAKAAEAKALAAVDAKIATDMKAFKFNRNASYSTDPVFGRNQLPK